MLMLIMHLHRLLLMHLHRILIILLLLVLALYLLIDPNDRLPPSYLSEYHCALLPFSSFSPSYFPSEQKTPYPLSSVLSYDNLSPHFQAFIMAYTLETEPKTFKQAMASEKWRESVKVEFDAL